MLFFDFLALFLASAPVAGRHCKSLFWKAAADSKGFDGRLDVNKLFEKRVVFNFKE